MIKRFLMVVMLFTTLSLMADSSYYDFNGKKVVLQQRFELIALHGGTVGESVMDSLSTFKGRLSINRVSSVTNYKDWKYLADKLATFGVSAWPVVIDNAGNQMILDGTIGIEFNKGISELQQRDIVEKLSLEIIEIDALNPHFLMVAVQMGADPFAISRTLFEQGFVRWAQPNWFSKYVSKAAPNDPYYPNQWHLDQIAAESAWDFETGDSSVKIAIVDSGVETDHPDLIVTTGYDYLDGDSNPNPDTAHDDHYGVPHGTSVAGIAASRTNNSLGVAGVCQNCTIIPIRLIGGYISSYTLRNALKYAVDQGAWVVNNSWGPSNSSCNNISANSFQASAVEYGKTDGRGGKGTIMVWAAGNDSCDTSTDGDLKNNDIVVVSALTSYGSFASYSNYGDEVDVSAGAASYTTDIVGAYGYNYQSGGSDGDGLSNLDYTSVFSGTSAAAPVVSGAIALMLSANPELTFSGALNCLKSTAKKITKYCSKGGWTTQSDIYLESGSKEHSPCFGFGRVDVNLMVQGAINGTCGTCVKIADVDLCYGAGSGVDDDCEGGIDDNCTSGGNGKAGDACDANSECANTGSDFFCKTAWQDGYCSGNCSSDGDCYGSGVSVCRDSECRKTCVSSSGLRDGYKCEGGIVIPGIPVYEPYCGDSVVEGDEECDDGNKVSGDGCNFVCQKEPECEDGTMECRYTALFWCNGGFWEIVRDCVDEGKFCETNAFTSYCETPGICGNSTKESGEECDDGNTVTEQCSYGKTECIVCASNCTRQPGVVEFCGDNVKNGSEECDDGNSINGDGCDDTCKTEIVIECTPDNMECRATNLYWCNAGVWSFVKDCTPLDRECVEDGIYAACQIIEVPDETVDETVDETADEIIDEDVEAQDFSPVDDDNETVDEIIDEDVGAQDVAPVDDDETVDEAPDETVPPSCGNGVVEGGEECDDGNNLPGDGCDPLCKNEVPPECGNSIVEAGEECDDGNNIPGDGCDPLCKDEEEESPDSDEDVGTQDFAPVDDDSSHPDADETPDETADEVVDETDNENLPSRKTQGCSVIFVN